MRAIAILAIPRRHPARIVRRHSERRAAESRNLLSAAREQQVPPLRAEAIRSE